MKVGWGEWSRRWALAVALTVGGGAFAAPAKAPIKPTPSADRTMKVPEKFRLSLSDADRDELADKKRDQVIGQLERISAKFDDDSPQKPEMLFQLSEYDYEKSKYLYRVEMRKQDAEYARQEQALNKKAEAPKADHTGSERYRALTMGIYEKLLKAYPGYERKDEVIFSLAFNLYEVARNDEALMRYDQLIHEFPKSQFVPDAYVQLGNHWFDHNDLEKATANYQKALATHIPKIYSYALYKLAWCDYNAGDYEKALKKLHTVIDYADDRGKEMVDLHNEALNDLITVYVRLDRADEAVAYFQKKTSGQRQHRLIAKMANALADAGHSENAIRVYKVLLARTPEAADAPDWQQAIVRCYESLRQRTQVKAEVRRLAELYRPGSTWWTANAKTPEVLKNAFDVSEEAMRTVVTDYHQEAQKTKQVETYRLARDIYKQYLDAFSTNTDEKFVSDQAFNLTFYSAEILWTLEDWTGAAEAYDRVGNFKIPNRESAREVSNEKYRETAAYDAILAYDKLVKIEKGQLSTTDLRDGQKVDETRGKGKVDKGARIVRKDAEAEEKALTANEAKLVAACDVYVTRFPNPKDEIDIRYQAAVVLYDSNHFVDAAKRFAEIINRWPGEHRSQQAADLTMSVLETRGEYVELNRLARSFLANRRLTQPGTEFAQRVSKVVEGSQYKYVDEVIYKKEKDPKRAADEFAKFVEQFPQSEHADQALTFAMIIYQDAAELDRSIAMGERVLREYPDSPLALKARYTLARSYEKTADFKRAAETYESFLAAYDRFGKKPATEPHPRAKQRAANPGEQAALLKEASAWRPDAQFNAGLWWEGLGRSDRAIPAYQAYVKTFSERKDVPEIAFNIGLIYEKDHQWKDAAETFAAFSKSYARDARVGGAQRYLAAYHEMKDRQALGDAREAERLQRELAGAFARLAAKDKGDVDVLNAYGHARFLGVEPLWKQYSGVRLNRLTSLKNDLALKQKRLQELERAYVDVLSTGAGEYGIAALTRIGLAYADLSRNILESPNPKGLTEDQTAMYRGELDKLALPLEDRSVEALEKGLAKAYELNVYNRWTLAAQDQVNKLRPGQYGRIRDVRYEGSESVMGEHVVEAKKAPPTAMNLGTHR